MLWSDLVARTEVHQSVSKDFYHNPVFSIQGCVEIYGFDFFIPFLLQSFLPKVIKKSKYCKEFLSWKITLTKTHQGKERVRTPEIQCQRSPEEEREKSINRGVQTTYSGYSTKNRVIPIFLNKKPVGTVSRHISTKATHSTILWWRSWVWYQISDTTSNEGMGWLDERRQPSMTRL